MNILREDPKYKALPVLPNVSLVPLFDEIYRPADEPFELLPPLRPDPRSLAVIVHSSGEFGSIVSFSANRIPITVYVLQVRQPSRSRSPGRIWACLCIVLFLVSIPISFFASCLLNILYAYQSDFGDRDMTGIKLSCHVSCHDR